MTFGEILKELLHERGITQKRLAMSLNIAASTLGNYIQDSREPDFETLKRLADFFDVTIDYLLGYPDKTANDSTENELLTVFRSLPCEQQELYLEQGKAMVRVNQRKRGESLKSTS